MDEDDLLAEDDPRGEIARIESEIEGYAQTLERCGKVAVAARIAMAGGAVCLVAVLFGFIAAGAATALAAITAVIGGIVLSGSNTSTARQAEAALQAAEAGRARLIGMIDLRVINGGRLS